MSARTRGPSRWTVIKDVLSFGGAWGLIYWEVLHGPVNLAVLALAGTLLGVPGFSVVLPRLVAALGSAGTNDSSSESQEQGSSR